MKTKKQRKRTAKVYFAGNGKAKMSKAGYGQSGKMLSTMRRMMAVDDSSDAVKHPSKKKKTPHLDLMREISKTNTLIGRMASMSIRPNWISMIPEPRKKYITTDKQARKWILDIKRQLIDNPARSFENTFSKSLMNKINNVK